MPKNFINYFSVVVVLSLSIALSAQELSVVRLTNEQLELGWKKGVGGYTLETLKVKGTNGWEIMEIANISIMFYMLPQNRKRHHRHYMIIREKRFFSRLRNIVILYLHGNRTQMLLP